MHRKIQSAALTGAWVTLAAYEAACAFSYAPWVLPDRVDWVLVSGLGAVTVTVRGRSYYAAMRLGRRVEREARRRRGLDADDTGDVTIGARG